VAILAPQTASAAGGPHVVDDSEVEAPGVCHLENSVTHSSHDQWHINAGVGCTPEAIASLEIGGFIGHFSAAGSDETMIGITPKLTLRPADSGLGVALAGSLSYGFDRSRFETASLIAAVTVPASDELNINLNAGWTWTEAAPGSAAFAGAQAEWAVGAGVTLMAEGFARNHGKAGAQAGLRWTSPDGQIDLDLLAGRFGDGSTPTMATIGMTLRW
jgi:hypothetical protein